MAKFKEQPRRTGADRRNTERNANRSRRAAPAPPTRQRTPIMDRLQNMRSRVGGGGPSGPSRDPRQGAIDFGRSMTGGGGSTEQAVNDIRNKVMQTLGGRGIYQDDRGSYQIRGMERNDPSLAIRDMAVRGMGGSPWEQAVAQADARLRQGGMPGGGGPGGSIIAGMPNGTTMANDIIARTRGGGVPQPGLGGVPPTLRTTEGSVGGPISGGVPQPGLGGVPPMRPPSTGGGVPQPGLGGVPPVRPPSTGGTVPQPGLGGVPPVRPPSTGGTVPQPGLGGVPASPNVSNSSPWVPGNVTPLPANRVPGGPQGSTISSGYPDVAPRPTLPGTNIPYPSSMPVQPRPTLPGTNIPSSLSVPGGMYTPPSRGIGFQSFQAPSAAPPAGITPVYPSRTPIVSAGADVGMMGSVLGSMEQSRQEQALHGLFGGTGQTPADPNAVVTYPVPGRDYPGGLSTNQQGFTYQPSLQSSRGPIGLGGAPVPPPKVLGVGATAIGLNPDGSTPVNRVPGGPQGSTMVSPGLGGGSMPSIYAPPGGAPATGPYGLGGSPAPPPGPAGGFPPQGQGVGRTTTPTGGQVSPTQYPTTAPQPGLGGVMPAAPGRPTTPVVPPGALPGQTTPSRPGQMPTVFPNGQVFGSPGPTQIPGFPSMGGMKDMSGLGAQISGDVASRIAGIRQQTGGVPNQQMTGLASLEGLGDRIQASVMRGISGTSAIPGVGNSDLSGGLGQSIMDRVRSQLTQQGVGQGMPGMPRPGMPAMPGVPADMGASIRAQVQGQLGRAGVGLPGMPTTPQMPVPGGPQMPGPSTGVPVPPGGAPAAPAPAPAGSIGAPQGTIQANIGFGVGGDWGSVNQYDASYVKYGQQYGVPPEMLKAMAVIESGGQMIDGPGGAYGVMQIKTGIWGTQAAQMGYDLNTAEGQIGFAAAFLGGAVPGVAGSTPEERFLNAYYPTDCLDCAPVDGNGITQRMYLDSMYDLMGQINAANTTGTGPATTQALPTNAAGPAALPPSAPPVPEALPGDAVMTPAGKGPGATTTTDPTGVAIADAADDYVGTAYVWGGGLDSAQGPSPGNWDCSGFVWYLSKNNGGSVPSTGSHQQYTWASQTGRLQQDLSSLQPGDIIFWDTAGGGEVADGNSVSHVSVYIGDGRMIHAAHACGAGETQGVDCGVIESGLDWYLNNYTYMGHSTMY